MKKTILLNDLTYPNEHLSCLNNRIKDSNGFVYDSYNSGEIVPINFPDKNRILFVIDGDCNLLSSSGDSIRVNPMEMVCLYKQIDYQLEILTDSGIIIFYFDQPISSCDKIIFSNYLKQISSDQDLLHSGIIEIRYPLSSFLDTLIYYLRNQINCYHIHEIKHRELFFILRNFYKKKEIATLLWPVLNDFSDFRYFIETNLSRINSIKELITLSPYSPAVFYRKFKAEYGDILPQHWLMQRRKKQILEIATMPGMNPKEMMHQLNINSMSTLRRFCLALFSLSPAQLIQYMQTNQSSSQFEIEL